MFLSNLHDANAFSLYMGGNLSARRAAIEAELRNLKQFAVMDVTVEIEGRFIIVGGFVDSQRDFYRALDIATDIAGSDRVIFRMTCAHSFVS